MIALIAHDKKKSDMVNFVQTHMEYFWKTRTIATASTGELLNRELNLNVERVAHGPEGGELAIAARVESGEVHAVIFFRDPLTAQPHEPDVTALIRLSDVYNVPLATNMGMAEVLVQGLKEGFLAWRDLIEGQREKNHE